MEAQPPMRASSIWFSSLVALLVALGAQAFLEGIVPASVTDMRFGTPDITIIHRAGGWPLWVTEAIIRFLSFALGGFVGVLLARALSARLVVLLLAAAAAATVFQQLPGPGPVFWWVLWSLVAPIGIALGAWVANAKHAA